MPTATKKKQLKLKTVTQPRRTANVHIRYLPEERSALQQAADKFTGGDLSKWVRYSSLNYVPSARELESA